MSPANLDLASIVVTPILDSDCVSEICSFYCCAALLTGPPSVILHVSWLLRSRFRLVCARLSTARLSKKDLCRPGADGKIEPRS